MRPAHAEQRCGLGVQKAGGVGATHVKKCYYAEPVFITMYMPRMLDVLEKVGIDNRIVCPNINKIGLRMCEGIDRHEKTLATRTFRPIAMSVLASGAILPQEAIDYVCGLPNVQAIVFGASGRGNIRETKRLVTERWTTSPLLAATSATK